MWCLYMKLSYETSVFRRPLVVLPRDMLYLVPSPAARRSSPVTLPCQRGEHEMSTVFPRLRTSGAAVSVSGVAVIVIATTSSLWSDVTVKSHDCCRPWGFYYSHCYCFIDIGSFVSRSCYLRIFWTYFKCDS